MHGPIYIKFEYCFVSGVHQIALGVNGPKYWASMALNIPTLNRVLYSLPISSAAGL
jgi:hypothetical protein